MRMCNGGAMPTSARRYAVDTSVAIAALDAAHAAHEICHRAVQARRPGLAGHAAFETMSVLTRMPGQLSIEATIAGELIGRVFPTVYWLDDTSSAGLLRRLGTVGIAGGAIYDALVGEAARINECVLLTRDMRAKRTYDLLGVSYELIGLD